MLYGPLDSPGGPVAKKHRGNAELTQRRNHIIVSVSAENSFGAERRPKGRALSMYVDPFH